MRILPFCSFIFSSDQVCHSGVAGLFIMDSAHELQWHVYQDGSGRKTRHVSYCPANRQGLDLESAGNEPDTTQQITLTLVASRSRRRNSHSSLTPVPTHCHLKRGHFSYLPCMLVLAGDGGNPRCLYPSVPLQTCVGSLTFSEERFLL